MILVPVGPKSKLLLQIMVCISIYIKLFRFYPNYYTIIAYVKISKNIFSNGYYNEKIIKEW